MRPGSIALFLMSVGLTGVTVDCSCEATAMKAMQDGKQTGVSECLDAHLTKWAPHLRFALVP